MSYVDALTLVHVVISLAAIAAGFVVLFGMIANKTLRRWTDVFLVTTVLTSVTGYLFPFTRLLPSHIVGAISLVVLAPALYAWYGARLAGRWRLVFSVTATMAFYLNFFVLVAQAFQKIPPLTALAPTQTEPPFAIAQGAFLLVFCLWGYRAARRFRAAA